MNMERLRGPGRAILGVVLIGQAALLGIKTGEALASDDRNPDELIFQQGLRELTQVPNEETGEIDDFSNYEIVNGTVLNLIAIGGLGAAGVGQFRRRQQERQEANEAQQSPGNDFSGS